MNNNMFNKFLLKEGHVLKASFAKFMLGNRPHLKIGRRIKIILFGDEIYILLKNINL